MENKYYKMVHVPMNDAFYSLLKSEAEKSQVSVAQLARQAITAWLEQRKKQIVFQQVHEYAQANAGISDLDQDLESSSIDHLLETEKNS